MHHIVYYIRTMFTVFPACSMVLYQKVAIVDDSYVKYIKVLKYYEDIVL